MPSTEHGDRNIGLEPPETRPVLQPLSRSVVTEFNRELAALTTAEEKTAAIDRMMGRMREEDPVAYEYMERRGSIAGQRKGTGAQNEVWSALIELWELSRRQAIKDEEDAKTTST